MSFVQFIALASSFHQYSEITSYPLEPNSHSYISSSSTTITCRTQMDDSCRSESYLRWLKRRFRNSRGPSRFITQCIKPGFALTYIAERESSKLGSEFWVLSKTCRKCRKRTFRLNSTTIASISNVFSIYIHKNTSRRWFCAVANYVRLRFWRLSQWESIWCGEESVRAGTGK